MPRKNGPFSRYLKGSVLWAIALIAGLLGGSGAAIFKALGLEHPVPTWTWLLCLAVVTLAGYRLYLSLYREHQELLDRARSQARLPPEMRARVNAIKRLAGVINAAIQGMGTPLGGESLREKLELLRELASRTGEHQIIRIAVTLYIGATNAFLETMNTSETTDSRKKSHQDLVKEELKSFEELMAKCNRLLDRYPDIGEMA